MFLVGLLLGIMVGVVATLVVGAVLLGSICQDERRYTDDLQ